MKKAGTRDSATNAEKRFKYEKEKRPERIFNAKWCKGRSRLKYDRDENVMICSIVLWVFVLLSIFRYSD
jgi:hypothetical protein